MKNQQTSANNFGDALLKLSFRQKQLICQAARLEFRIFVTITRLNALNEKIAEEEKNILSLTNAIHAAGESKVAEKLRTWKVKAEYKLFRLNLRKSKIDIIKLAINQSKLEQARQALIALEKDLEKINTQQQAMEKPMQSQPALPPVVGLFEFYMKEKKTQYEKPIHQSVRSYIEDYLKMAS